MPENLCTIVLPTPFSVGPINVYLLIGGEITLIDTGPKWKEAWMALAAGLAEYGYTLADIGQIIITHGHADHFGLAKEIVAHSGARVCAHRDTLPWLTEYDVEWQRHFEFCGDVFRQAGVPEGAWEAYAASRGSLKDYADAVPVDGFLGDGDILSLGGIAWEVIHTPGHAKGLICLYQREGGLLISGDLLLSDRPSNPVLEPPPEGTGRRPRSMIDYMRSLQRVEEMEINIILPAHGEPIYDHCASIAQRRAFHQARAQQILGTLNSGEKTAYEIWAALFPQLYPLDVLLGISEVIAHLDILQQEKEVVAYEKSGLFYYSKTT